MGNNHLRPGNNYQRTHTKSISCSSINLNLLNRNNALNNLYNNNNNYSNVHNGGMNSGRSNCMNDTTDFMTHL